MRKTNSAEILREDFGCYPPKPLEVDNSLADVQVSVRPFRFVSLFFFRARMIFLLAKSCFTDNVSTEILTSEPSTLKLVDAAKANFKGALVPFKHAKSNLKSKTPIKVVKGGLQTLGLILGICVVAVPMFLYFFYLNLKQTLKFKKRTKAFFFPSRLSANQVMFNAQIPTEDLCWLISHEHLHLLQNHFEQKANKSSDSVDLSRPNDTGLLKEAAKQGGYGDYMEYLFLRHETEARLHELVLVYYRVAKELPLNLNDFLRMLLHFECFSTPIKTNYPELYEELPHMGVETITPRSGHIMRDLQLMVSSFESSEKLKVYLLEALPKMYSNLLGYYGDQNASKIMNKNIPSISLYEAMYNSRRTVGD